MTSKRAQQLCFGLLLALGLSCSAHAQKIGFINIPYILNEHPKVQQVNETLMSEFSEREAALRAAQASLQEKVEKLQRDAPAMGQSEIESMESALRSEERELQRNATAFQEDVQVRQNELGQQLQRDIAEQIQNYCEDEGYDLCVGDAIFVSERLDITADVLEAITDD